MILIRPNQDPQQFGSGSGKMILIRPNQDPQQLWIRIRQNDTNPTESGSATLVKNRDLFGLQMKGTLLNSSPGRDKKTKNMWYNKMQPISQFCAGT
jgi:hypothetical protein